MSFTALKDSVLAGVPYYQYVMGTHYDQYIPGSVYERGMPQDNLAQLVANGPSAFAQPNLPADPRDKGRPNPWMDGGYYVLPDIDIARDYAPFQVVKAPDQRDKLSIVYHEHARGSAPVMDAVGGTFRATPGPLYRLTDGGIPGQASFNGTWPVPKTSRPAMY